MEQEKREKLLETKQWIDQELDTCINFWLTNGMDKEHGGVYTEHFSSLDGAKPQGYIVKAAMNPEMKRGELIIGVETDKWADDIHKLEPQRNAEIVSRNHSADCLPD